MDTPNWADFLRIVKKNNRQNKKHNLPRPTYFCMHACIYYYMQQNLHDSRAVDLDYNYICNIYLESRTRHWQSIMHAFMHISHCLQEKRRQVDHACMHGHCVKDRVLDFNTCSVCVRCKILIIVLHVHCKNKHVILTRGSVSFECLLK